LWFVLWVMPEFNEIRIYDLGSEVYSWLSSRGIQCNAGELALAMLQRQIFGYQRNVVGENTCPKKGGWGCLTNETCEKRFTSRKCFRRFETWKGFAGWNATSSPLRRATEERSWETFGGPEAWQELKSAVARFHVFSHIFQQKWWGMFMWTSLT